MSNDITLREFKACMELVNESILNNVYRINGGGCAFFASELAKRMQSIGITDYEIVVFGSFDSTPPDISEVERTMGQSDSDRYDVYEWSRNGIDFAHVVIRWQGLCWDAECPFTDDNGWRVWKRYPGSFPEDSLHAIGQSTKGWNDLYDRSQDDLVREILDCAFDLLH